MELLHELRVSTHASTMTPEGADGLLARAREAAEDERRLRRSPFLLAGSRDGLTHLPRMLAMATDTALTVRRLAGPLPAGTTADVLGAGTRSADHVLHGRVGAG